MSSCNATAGVGVNREERGIGRKERKGRKKESGLIGAGLKPALLDLALGQFAQAAQIIKDSSTKDLEH
jgi:hypothetical protein